MGGTYKRGKYWHIWFIDQHGNRQFEHGTPKWTLKKDAESQLALRETEVSQHSYQGKQIDQITLTNLCDLLIEDYQVNKRKSLRNTVNRLDILKNKLGPNTKAVHLPALLKSFIVERQKDGWSNAYINRFLSAVHRMYQIAADHEPPLVARVPKISKLDENNVRKGFIDHEFYLKFKPALPDYIQIALLLSYVSTMRRTEVFTLRISQFNKTTGYVLIEVTKNGEQRGFFLRGEYYQEVCDWVLRTEREYPDCPYIVHHDGRPIKDFRTVWETALKTLGIGIRYKCRACGNHEYQEQNTELKCSKCGGKKFRKNNEKIFHDIRRSAARNMKNADASREDIMKIGGWKTGSTFTRYNITGEEEQRTVADKTLDYLRRQEAEIRKHRGE